VAEAVVVLQAFELGPFTFPLPYSSRFGLWQLDRVRSDAAETGIWNCLLHGGCGDDGAGNSVRKNLEKHCRRMRRDCSWHNVCAGVIWWMVSIRGVSFITQENIMSWPSSFFMKTNSGAFGIRSRSIVRGIRSFWQRETRNASQSSKNFADSRTYRIFPNVSGTEALERHF
jgi:hypothetical protein